MLAARTSWRPQYLAEDKETSDNMEGNDFLGTDGKVNIENENGEVEFSKIKKERTWKVNFDADRVVNKRLLQQHRDELLLPSN
jgi:hypothetical protein